MPRAIKTIILIVIMTCIINTGCWFSTPIKKVRRDPIPVETEESKEQVRMALDAIQNYLNNNKVEEALMLVSALIVKSGEPVSKITYTATGAYNLSIAILKGVKEHREALAAWQDRYDSQDIYSLEGERTTTQKIKSTIGWGVIILGIWALLAPASLIALIRWIRRRGEVI